MPLPQHDTRPPDTPHDDNPSPSTDTPDGVGPAVGDAVAAGDGDGAGDGDTVGPAVGDGVGVPLNGRSSRTTALANPRPAASRTATRANATADVPGTENAAENDTTDPDDTTAGTTTPGAYAPDDDAFTSTTARHDPAATCDDDAPDTTPDT